MISGNCFFLFEVVGEGDRLAIADAGQKECEAHAVFNYFCYISSTYNHFAIIKMSQ